MMRQKECREIRYLSSNESIAHLTGYRLWRSVLDLILILVTKSVCV